MTEERDTAAAKRPGRWLKPALFVSVGINLAFAGMMAGAFMRHGPDRRAGPGPDSYARPYMSALPQEARREMFRSLRDARGKGFPDRQARRALYGDVLEALRAEPFDAAALEQAAQRQAGSGVKVLETTQAAWIGIVSGMSAAERVAYAARIEEALKRRPGKKKQ
ncbi:periplasmic heavy metal sensor [uncultured Roseobacter sp.]|uniref:periplasmic heavy metal sensor n=1 Tax=uncultured Roseobacter sp. TaxID=114847 RepID=UPI002621FC5B|nr:periplasmic heavy metal sensor [uncultured Roseobacter sp.]